MIISLLNGKVIELPTEVIFLSDREYEEYIQAVLAADMGDFVEEPFKFSSFENPSYKEEEENDEGFLDDDLLLTRDDI